MTLEEMKAMELNEIIDIDYHRYRIQRVPNGWNYIYMWNNAITSQFVPETLLNVRKNNDQI